MKIAIMQPYFLPYISYWQLIHCVDKYIILDDVNYINKGWINRNYILIDGEKHLFTIPLLKASQNKLINEIEIEHTKEKLIKKIERAYKKAPYFTEVFGMVAQFLEFNDLNIARFVSNSIKGISDYLGITTELILSSELEKNRTLRGKDRILNICEIFNTNEYINAIGGIELYGKNDFKTNGVDLRFLHTKPMTYEQFGNPFIPNLSILDVLMFNSVEEIKTMLENYILD